MTRLPGDGPDMPVMGRLWTRMPWWARCRWCSRKVTSVRGIAILCAKCDVPDASGKSPFPEMYGDNAA